MELSAILLALCVMVDTLLRGPITDGDLLVPP